VLGNMKAKYSSKNLTQSQIKRTYLFFHSECSSCLLHPYLRRGEMTENT
jgi:hypothetical protein